MNHPLCFRYRGEIFDDVPAYHGHDAPPRHDSYESAQKQVHTNPLQNPNQNEVQVGTYIYVGAFTLFVNYLCNPDEDQQAVGI